jgi:hypothetical protein
LILIVLVLVFKKKLISPFLAICGEQKNGLGVGGKEGNPGEK